MSTPDFPILNIEKRYDSKAVIIIAFIKQSSTIKDSLEAFLSILVSLNCIFSFSNTVRQKWQEQSSVFLFFSYLHQYFKYISFQISLIFNFNICSLLYLLVNDKFTPRYAIKIFITKIYLLLLLVVISWDVIKCLCHVLLNEDLDFYFIYV